MTPHDFAIQIHETIKTSGGKLNEADTRHQIIDATLHDVLGWPRTLTRCEPYVGPGYADYVLHNRRDAQLFFLEAKKSGASFKLPSTFNSERKSKFVRIKTLLTSPEIKAAMEQVREYCFCLLYTSPSPRDKRQSRMPSSA